MNNYVEVEYNEGLVKLCNQIALGATDVSKGEHRNDEDDLILFWEYKMNSYWITKITFVDVIPSDYNENKTLCKIIIFADQNGKEFFASKIVEE